MEFEFLDKKFHDRLYAFIDKCRAIDIVLSFDKGFVHPKEQAKLWRQSRSDSQIDLMIGELHANDAPFLVKLLTEAATKPGVHMTDELPGYSWHNWGQAYIYTVLGEDGRDLLPTSNVYKKTAELAKDVGLTAGFYLKPKQPYLIQLSTYKSPINEYSVQEISKAMERLYGNN
jgi:hypothetical protein